MVSGTRKMEAFEFQAFRQRRETYGLVCSVKEDSNYCYHRMVAMCIYSAGGEPLYPTDFAAAEVRGTGERLQFTEFLLLLTEAPACYSTCNSHRGGDVRMRIALTFSKQGISKHNALIGNRERPRIRSMLTLRKGAYKKTSAVEDCAINRRFDYTILNGAFVNKACLTFNKSRIPKNKQLCRVDIILLLRVDFLHCIVRF